MSKKSNVNPDHYKTAGRDPQGHDVVQDVERQKLRQERAWLEKQGAGHQPARKSGDAASSGRRQQRNASEGDSSRDESTANAKGTGRQVSKSESKQNRSDAEGQARSATPREDELARGSEATSAAEGGNPERHASSKSGKRSSAQKAAGRRHESRPESEPAPASHKVPGASGKEGRQGAPAVEDEEQAVEDEEQED